MNLDNAYQEFVVESRDLLQQMEEALLTLERSPEDDDSLNAVFRAAHTIKGSSGLFALDFVVSFTHVAESVLDRARSHEVEMDEALTALFLEVCDHIRKLIDTVAEKASPDAELLAAGQVLEARLNARLNAESSKPVDKIVAIKQEQEVEVQVDSGDQAGTDSWHISLRFKPDVFRNGMDPFSFVRYLRTLGTIEHIVTLTEQLPPPESFDPESCYLGFEINFKSDADKKTIESVFDFVRDDCEINILPPRSKIVDYIHFIEDHLVDEMRLGEILVQCGTLTPAELEQILARQNAESVESKPLIGKVIVDSKLVQPAVVNAALGKQKQVKETKNNEASLIRVDANKLDQLINMVGELIIAGAGANLIARQSGLTNMLEATDTISRLVENVRDSALALRMTQIGATFNRFQRVVRDVSKELGKDIRLEISGEETELDKTVVEKIADPLTHLVRNSMDHGIEAADVRVANGKPAHGTLKLNAYHDAGSVVIEVSDDGAGLRKEKILAKALERGLITPEQQLSDDEIYNLIFEAGFSTADAVSNLSGRGVGMDVVKRNIQSLRGTIAIYTKQGAGTTISIRLPLTLAIIDGFLVNVSDASYVIPLDMVVECIELSPEDQASSIDAKRDFINLRGKVLPYLKLRDQFECEGEPPARQNVVVVQYGNQTAGLVVDKLLGEFQTVIKPLGKVFSYVKGIGGFTILGNGNVALILDVPRMMQQANKVISNSAEVA